MRASTSNLFFSPKLATVAPRLTTRWLAVAWLALVIACAWVATPSAVRADEPPRSDATGQRPADDSTASDATDVPDTPASDSPAPPETNSAADPKPVLPPRHPFPRRVDAPGLDGGVGWINTAGPLDLRQLRGKFVVLDFWTYCCINCIHILPELKKLEHAYPGEIVVIGVHSAKFDTEKDSQNITEAVVRYDIEHPVINDAEHAIWERYGITGWPALRVIDPEGKLVAAHGGEIDFESLDQFFQKALPYYRAKGLLDETPLRFDLARDALPPTPLRFPGKVLADPEAARLYIADSGHHRIVVTGLDGKLLDVIGSGRRGLDDGDYATATFAQPQGMALHDGHLYVADTENHAIRKIDLAARQVTKIAGTGKQNRGLPPGADQLDFVAGAELKLPDRWVSEPGAFPLASPWAVFAQGEHLYIAMAGRHQIWRMTLDEQEIEVYAGSGIENITDGPLAPEKPLRLLDRFVDPGSFSAFAQPSGLASDGEWLYIADSEGSAIRAVPFDATKNVKTVVGATDQTPGPRGRPIYPLFSFGDRDGQGEEVLLQHALGVVHHDGQLFVSDTYNNKIKVVDLEERTAKTLVGDTESGDTDDPPRFDEPAGITYAGGKLYVADTNNHRIRVIDLETRAVTTLQIDGLAPPPAEQPSAGLPESEEVVRVEGGRVRPVDGVVRLNVQLKLPEGWKINPRAPLRYQVDKTSEGGLVAPGEPLGTLVRLPEEERRATFSIPLPLREEGEGGDVVRVRVRYYYCQEGAEGLCKVGDITWDVEFAVADDGEPAVTLEHRVP
ncbi:MAG: hypothetical protein DWQ42_21605 [Planctomycetota bacterium]|nr:MAG: hypothetical protein DWQ42_21605 [Planctomycetota bacterium]REK40973.1 MAG: hypothetical protein DWQ46_14905 [Planctomycetota bacterium]